MEIYKLRFCPSNIIVIL